MINVKLLLEELERNAGDLRETVLMQMNANSQECRSTLEKYIILHEKRIKEIKDIIIKEVTE